MAGRGWGRVSLNQIEKVVEKPKSGGRDRVNTEAWLQQGAKVLNSESHLCPGWAAVNPGSAACTSGLVAKALSVPPSPDHPHFWAGTLLQGGLVPSHHDGLPGPRCGLWIRSEARASIVGAEALSV